MRIVPEQGETKGIDIASAIAAADAKECKGKFATGREAELIDSEVIFRGFRRAKIQMGRVRHSILSCHAKREALLSFHWFPRCRPVKRTKC